LLNSVLSNREEGNQCRIAPVLAHAQHMPHTYYQIRAYGFSQFSTNINSAFSAVCYAESKGQVAWDEEGSMLWVICNMLYLQIGENEKVMSNMPYLKSFEKIFPANLNRLHGLPAIRAE